MISLASMWNNWGAPASIKKAAKKVGITTEGLSVAAMQADKFEKASELIEQTQLQPKPQETPEQNSPCSSSSFDSSCISSVLNDTLNSPVSSKRKGSHLYWKEKATSWKKNCKSLQKMIADLHEKSIDLKEIPGLLTVQKVKQPNESTPKPTTRVTQVHGSMEGKDVLQLVENIRNNKEQKAKEKQEKEAIKKAEREAFYRCKEGCVCQTKVCEAAMLKQCPSCDNIMKSVCSKIKCMQDGKKPVMILPKSASHKKRAANKELFLSSEPPCDDESLSDQSNEETTDASDEEMDSLSSDIKELCNTCNIPPKS